MDIRPFRGWRFCGPEVGEQIAPPYDILTQTDKDELLGRSEKNIVAVDLPHIPPKELGPEEAYKAAAMLLEQWKQSGVLIQEPEPALYVYEQSYTWAGKDHVRRAMLAGVRATPLGVDVIPHEHTFAGPKADRLELTTVTKTQLSPIFGFYDDSTDKLTEMLRTAAATEPDLQGELNGVTEKLWVVTDKNTIASVRSVLASVPVYIADGHHRYTTAMNYRDALLNAGLIDEQHEANFVLFALVARSDPGLLVLPTHRMISGLKDDFDFAHLREALGEDFELRTVSSPADLADTDGFLDRFGTGAMGLLFGDETWIAKLARPEPMTAAAPDQPDAWRTLDVAVLHELIIEKALVPWKSPAFTVEYTPDGNVARTAVRTGESQLAVLLQSTPLEAVTAVANASAAMPHKSTYFYPKLATGMVLKPLE